MPMSPNHPVTGPSTCHTSHISYTEGLSHVFGHLEKSLIKEVNRLWYPVIHCMSA
jgi:hypothetical protein